MNVKYIIFTTQLLCSGTIATKIDTASALVKNYYGSLLEMVNGR